MSFDAFEQSLASGKPVRLYRFRRGVMRWLYTTAGRDIALGTEVFRTLAGGISDDGIIQSGDPDADELVITASADLDVAQLYRAYPPSDEVGLDVLDMHYGDTEALVSWAGSISTVNWPSLDRCSIRCRSLDASLELPGLVDTYSRSCTAVLGDTSCKVDLSSLMVEGTVSGADGLTLIVPAAAVQADGWYTGGYVEWPVGVGLYDRRHIEQHQGSTLQLLGGTVGITPGQLLRLYPGCDFLAATCHDKFGNSDNMRAVPHLQGKSPFDGDQVW